MEQDRRVKALLREGEEDDAGKNRMKILKRNLLKMKKHVTALASVGNREAETGAETEATDVGEWVEASEENKSLLI
jgi:hypothetical protein